MTMNRSILASICCGMFLLLLCAIATPVQSASWWSQSINVESKIGTDRSIQSLDVMYPLSHSNSSLLFTDLRGRIDDDDSVELNLGLAHRFVTSNPTDGLVPGVLSSNDAVLGYYGFADRLESRFDNTFYQGTIGAEYFTKNYSLRINGYLPEDERKPTTSFTQLQATGTQIFFEDRQNFERPLPGYDVELGRTFRFDGWQLYGRGSYFRFHHSAVAEVEGSRFRAGVQLNGSHPEVYLPEGSQLTLGAEWQNDQIRDEQTFGVVRFRMPFGIGIENQKSNIEEDNSELRSWQKDRLTERISRDVDVVTGQTPSETTGDTQAAVLASTGESLNDVALAKAGSSGTGTINNPGSLATAVNTAGTDGTVFVLGQVKTSGVVLPGGLNLLGGDVPLVESADGSIQVALAPTGDSPVIQGTAGEISVRFDTRTSGQVVQGLTMTGGQNALVGDGVDTVTIRDVAIRNTTGDAVRFVGFSPSPREGIVIRNNRIEGTVFMGDDYGGTIASGQIRNLVIEEAADLRLSSNLTVSQDLTIGGATGAFGNSFVMNDVTVGDSLSIGGDAGNRGSFKMIGVTVGDSMSVGRWAGSEGSFTMNNVSVGKSLDVAFNPGDSGTFKMNSVEVGDSLTIGRNAGITGGTFTMSGVSVGDSMSVGRYAGGEGTFRMNKVSVGDSMSVGNIPGEDGTFTMTGGDVGGKLTFGEEAGQLGGTVAISGVEVTGGLSMGDGAADGGTVTMNAVTVGDSLSIGDNPGNVGSFTMNEVTVGDSMSVGRAAGEEGTFTMNNVSVGDSLSIGENAGVEGIFRITGGDVGDGLSIGPEAGLFDGTVAISGVEVTGGLSMKDGAGVDGTVTLSGNTILTGDLAFDGTVVDQGGTITLSDNTIRAGDLTFKGSWGEPNPGTIEVLNNTVEDGIIDGPVAGTDGSGTMTCSNNTANTVNCP